MSLANRAGYYYRESNPQSDSGGKLQENFATSSAHSPSFRSSDLIPFGDDGEVSIQKQSYVRDNFQCSDQVILESRDNVK